MGAKRPESLDIDSINRLHPTEVFICVNLLLLFNPISAGVHENQDMLRGGQFDPPSKSHV